MGKFCIDRLLDNSGADYWVLFTHGQFHAPVAVIDGINARNLAERVLGINLTMPAVEDLGAAILAHRKKRKLSQTDFAELCNVSRNYISQIERGERSNVSMALYNRILEVMN